MAVIVAEPPGSTEVGLAEQLIVGGSNAFTANCAEQSADWPGLAPSVTWPFTVYVPAESAFVSRLTALEVLETGPVSEVQLYVAVFFGFRFKAVPVTVIGSPGKPDGGAATQA